MVSLSAAQPMVTETPIVDPLQVLNAGYYNLWFVTASMLGTSTTVNFNAQWSSFGRKTGGAWNWSGANGIAFKVTNLDSADQSLGLRLQTATGKVTPGFIVPAGQSREIVVEFQPLNGRNYGFFFAPPLMNRQHLRIFRGEGLDWSRVSEWALFSGDTDANRVRLDNVRLLTARPNMNGIVDGWGQYTQYNWAGKIDNADELQTQRDQEEADIAARPVTGQINGSTSLPAQTATGRWRLQQLPSGKWYFVSPQGRLFFSLGLNGVKAGQSTRVEGRESMFLNLPSVSSAPSHYESIGGDLAFNFTSWALQNKYGSTWGSDFYPKTEDRLMSWGVNTIGGYAHPSSINKISLPFTAMFDTNDYGTRLSVPTQIWNAPPDPFGSDFQGWIQNKYGATLTAYRQSTRFVGAFVDNEISWAPMDPAQAATDAGRYMIALATLKAPATQPSKGAFVDQLEAKYGSIAALNSAWGASFDSWVDLQSTTNFQPAFTATTRGDLGAFVRTFADTYYRKVDAALQAAGSTGLYLGSRDATSTPETRAAACANVDVYSTTIYKTHQQVDWSFPDITKPVLIAEFGFGAYDRGAFGVTVLGLNQGERAELGRQFCLSALRSSKVVGTHWFQLYDQPITGRSSDGENFNSGVVSVADVPYPEMVAAFRNLATNMYGIRGQ